MGSSDIAPHCQSCTAQYCIPNLLLLLSFYAKFATLQNAVIFLAQDATLQFYGILERRDINMDQLLQTPLAQLTQYIIEWSSYFIEKTPPF